MNILSWLDRHFQLVNHVKAEAQIHCPRCHSEVLYFNMAKKIGFCHKASCEYKPRLDDLIQIVGYGPEDDYMPLQSGSGPSEDVIVELPEGCDPLVYRNADKQGQIYSKFPIACNKVAERGVTPEDQFRFDLRYDGSRIYIPIYYQGKMVHYIGRAAWWRDLHIPRYKYAYGSHPTQYLFNWDEAQTWPELTLVENTFNAIWLRKHLYCTTNFGSHLSGWQAKKIAQSKAKRVVLLWDEGAEKKAEQACDKLKTKFGVPAEYRKLTGQPDDHPLECLKAWRG